MNEISISDFNNIRIGQVENNKAGTGCTVFISEEGMTAGLDVRGGGPASRETLLLDPLMAAEKIYGIVVAGGSAFGLGAANGVMKYLEEKGIGYDVGVTKVPLVVQSDIFDLTVGDTFTRPDENMGYEAAKTAFEYPNYRDGNFGAGCGATVGKIAGMDRCMKTGIGSFCAEYKGLKVGAVVVLNALGDIFDYKNGEQIAGLLKEDKKSLQRTSDYMKSHIAPIDNKFTSSHKSPVDNKFTEHTKSSLIPDGKNFTGNTTIAVVMTNALFSKAQLCKISGMAHDGYARSINPVHTSADGDSIYTVSLGEVRADMDTVGIIAAEAVSEAIIRAVETADSAYGFPSKKSIF